MFSLESGGLGESMSCSKMMVRSQNGVESNSGLEMSEGSSGWRLATPSASMTVAKRVMYSSRAWCSTLRRSDWRKGGGEVLDPVEPVEGFGPVVGDGAVMRVVRGKKQFSG